MELTKLTIRQTIEGFKAKEFSALEVTSAYIKNIEENRHLNAFITDNFEAAIIQAKKSDEKIAAGQAGIWKACHLE